MNALFVVCVLAAISVYSVIIVTLIVAWKSTGKEYPFEKDDDNHQRGDGV